MVKEFCMKVTIPLQTTHLLTSGWAIRESFESIKTPLTVGEMYINGRPYIDTISITYVYPCVG